MIHSTEPVDPMDRDYYRNTHIPLAMKIMKADKVTLTEALPGKDAPPPFVMICHYQFASPEALAAAHAKPEMADVRADVAKVTDIKPIVMAGKTIQTCISEVTIANRAPTPPGGCPPTFL